jgi:hypothetical protein
MIELRAKLILEYKDGVTEGNADVFAAVVQDETLVGAIVELGKLLERSGQDFQRRPLVSLKE